MKHVRLDRGLRPGNVERGRNGTERMHVSQLCVGAGAHDREATSACVNITVDFDLKLEIYIEHWRSDRLKTCHSSAWRQNGGQNREMWTCDTSISINTDAGIVYKIPLELRQACADPIVISDRDKR